MAPELKIQFDVKKMFKCVYKCAEKSTPSKKQFASYKVDIKLSLKYAVKLSYIRHNENWL